MRHLSSMESVLAFTFLSFLFFACNKNIEQPYLVKGDSTLLKCKEKCMGKYIGIHSHDHVLPDAKLYTIENSPFYFFRSGEYAKPHDIDPICRQNMFGTDFSNGKFFDVSATGGLPVAHLAHGALGVNDQWIDVGESFIIELSHSLNGNLMDGFYLIFHGDSRDSGVVEMYKDNHLVGVVGHSKASCLDPLYWKPASRNYPVKFMAQKNKQRFDKVIIKQIKGRNHWIGYCKNDGIITAQSPTNLTNWFHLVKESK